MKNLLAILCLVAITMTTNAQTSEKKWGIGAGAGAYGAVNNNGGIGFMPELYLSRYISPRLDLMAKGDLGIFNSKLGNNLDIANAFLDLRLKLMDESKKFRPYLYAGPGFLADNGGSGLNFNVGAGVKYYIKPAIALFADGGYVNGIEVSRAAGNIRDNFWKATAGIEIDFGKAKDSDNDGVPDKRDKCPDTPAGVAVDKDGCPIDTDKDGIADYMDDCPTVAGLSSLKGCPDSDKDGVADKDDECPDTPGLAGLKGCPDSDGDGIADKNDKCPDTPKGYKVNAGGCPLDSDHDGIIDEEDKCPAVAGTAANNGCPEEKEKKPEEVKRVPAQTDIKVDPIHFEVNKSRITAYSQAKLDKLVSVLNENPSFMVEISGHTDATASEKYNLNLSQERVDSVIAYLKSKGIDKSRVFATKALGETKPVANNETVEGRLQNRRAEFKLVVEEK